MAATNAEVAPSLGRNLAGAAPSIDLHLLSPGIYNQGDNSGSAGELAGDRLHQVDLRISKLLRFGGARARANVNLYNAFNSNAVLLPERHMGLVAEPRRDPAGALLHVQRAV